MFINSRKNVTHYAVMFILSILPQWLMLHDLPDFFPVFFFFF